MKAGQAGKDLSNCCVGASAEFERIIETEGSATYLHF
jgi:hypothetical protein